jgi:hypothetical protein
MSEKRRMVHLMCSEIVRVMKPGGKYIVLSFGAPEIRQMALKGRDTDGWGNMVREDGNFMYGGCCREYEWTLHHEVLILPGKPNQHLYVLTKPNFDLESQAESN